MLLRTTITTFRYVHPAAPILNVCEVVGRAVLGHATWHFLSQSRHPMSAHLQAAWRKRQTTPHIGKTVEESAHLAITDYAEVRGETVDPKEVTRMLQGARA